jgi:hypothetical protein
MKRIINKRFLVNLIVTFVFIGNIYSQIDLSNSRLNWCGTITTKEDIEFIRGIINNSLKSTQIVSGYTYFRVQHHIVRDGSGNNGLSPSVIPDLMSYLNNVYSSINIQFYSCDSPVLINSDLYYSLDNSTEEASLRSAFNDPGAINIYYFNPTMTIDGVQYWAYTHPSGSTNFIGITNELAPNGSTATHEMGHFFGLLHTFRDYATPRTSSMELVTRGSGNNCGTAGDLLCDTPADPYIRENEVNTSCSYTGTAVDFNNVAYTPDVSNFMAYSRHACRNHFSTGQNSIISAMASSSGKQVFIHKTAIANNSNLNGNTTNDFITVTNSTVNSGSNVVLDACQEIEINDNFEVKVGATFEAK